MSGVIRAFFRRFLVLKYKNCAMFSCLELTAERAKVVAGVKCVALLR